MASRKDVRAAHLCNTCPLDKYGLLGADIVKSFREGSRVDSVRLVLNIYSVIVGKGWIYGMDPRSATIALMLTGPCINFNSRPHTPLEQQDYRQYGTAKSQGKSELFYL